MDRLYPNLDERFKGVCLICFVDTEPKYLCVNGHTICHRCNYFYSCPMCHMPLNAEISPAQMNALPSAPHPLAPTTQYMPQPMPRYSVPSPTEDQSPSAPLMNDFLQHERKQFVPSGNYQLETCSYSHLGCKVKVPEHLKGVHEARCQFRSNSEEEPVSTDHQHRHNELIECPYAAAGCKVRIVPWKCNIHKSFCIYRDKFQAVNDLSEDFASTTISDDDYDPEQLVECKFRRYGCMVSMPRRKKFTHEQKCNYKNSYKVNDEFDHSPVLELDPEEQVECRWAGNGCRVKPKRCRKQVHEDKCNYRMEECVNKMYGCDAIFIPAGKYAHESVCEFAN